MSQDYFGQFGIDTTGSAFDGLSMPFAAIPQTMWNNFPAIYGQQPTLYPQATRFQPFPYAPQGTAGSIYSMFTGRQLLSNTGHIQDQFRRIQQSRDYYAGRQQAFALDSAYMLQTLANATKLQGEDPRYWTAQTRALQGLVAPMSNWGYVAANLTGAYNLLGDLTGRQGSASQVFDATYGALLPRRIYATQDWTGVDAGRTALELFNDYYKHQPYKYTDPRTGLTVTGAGTPYRGAAMLTAGRGAEYLAEIYAQGGGMGVTTAREAGLDVRRIRTPLPTASEVQAAQQLIRQQGQNLLRQRDLTAADRGVISNVLRGGVLSPMDAYSLSQRLPAVDAALEAGANAADRVQTYADSYEILYDPDYELAAARGGSKAFARKIQRYEELYGRNAGARSTVLQAARGNEAAVTLGDLLDDLIVRDSDTAAVEEQKVKRLQSLLSGYDEQGQEAMLSPEVVRELGRVDETIGEIRKGMFQGVETGKAIQVTEEFAEQRRVMEDLLDFWGVQNATAKEVSDAMASLAGSPVTKLNMPQILDSLERIKASVTNFKLTADEISAASQAVQKQLSFNGITGNAAATMAGTAFVAERLAAYRQDGGGRGVGSMTAEQAVMVASSDFARAAASPYAAAAALIDRQMELNPNMFAGGRFANLRSFRRAVAQGQQYFDWTEGGRTIRRSMHEMTPVSLTPELSAMLGIDSSEVYDMLTRNDPMLQSLISRYGTGTQVAQGALDERLNSLRYDLWMNVQNSKDEAGLSAMYNTLDSQKRETFEGERAVQIGRRISQLSSAVLSDSALATDEVGRIIREIDTQLYADATFKGDVQAAGEAMLRQAGGVAEGAAFGADARTQAERRLAAYYRNRGMSDSGFILKSLGFGNLADLRTLSPDSAGKLMVEEENALAAVRDAVWRQKPTTGFIGRVTSYLNDTEAQTVAEGGLGGLIASAFNVDQQSIAYNEIMRKLGNNEQLTDQQQLWQEKRKAAGEASSHFIQSLGTYREALKDETSTDEMLERLATAVDEARDEYGQAEQDVRTISEEMAGLLQLSAASGELGRSAAEILGPDLPLVGEAGAALEADDQRFRSRQFYDRDKYARTLTEKESLALHSRYGQTLGLGMSSGDLLARGRQGTAISQQKRTALKTKEFENLYRRLAEVRAAGGDDSEILRSIRNLKDSQRRDLDHKLAGLLDSGEITVAQADEAKALHDELVRFNNEQIQLGLQAGDSATFGKDGFFRRALQGFTDREGWDKLSIDQVYSLMQQDKALPQRTEAAPGDVGAAGVEETGQMTLVIEQLILNGVNAGSATGLGQFSTTALGQQAARSMPS